MHDADVTVVGLGPVGGMLTNLLANCGLRVVALDREPGVMQLPRGVGIDGEIMRIMQTIGLAAELEPRLKVFRGAQYLDAQGQVVSTRPPITGAGPQGWPNRYNVHQPELEQVLRDGMRRSPLVRELVGHEAERITDTGDDVEVTARDLRTGSPVTVRSRYLVGADGGRSLTRRAIGAEYEDYGLNQPWIVADFQALPSADLPEINTHYADPVSPAIYIHVVRDIRRFEFRAAPGEDLENATDPDVIWRRVSRWLAPDQAVLLRAAVYTHRSLVARHWRKGRILLAGDAAHQTPPFLGQGLCTGARDAVSLAWRLRDVLGRGAPQRLLNGYGTERAEHARRFIKTASELGGHLSAPTKDAIDALNRRVGREGRGAAPKLGPGLFAPGDLGGTLAPQPRDARERLLDDIAGYEFAVVTPWPDDLSDEAREAVRRLRAAVVPSDDALESAFPAPGVIVRPDRYYYGGYGDAASLNTALTDIAAAYATDERARSHAH
ncbi:bifunctional 3-(3-hydroxy-phenyl)propionate/3-hydroxycinnamic acid hydroxylase [Actinomadura sp. LOL_016]|uniref:bifunctional 3-(3-hydroxy-phenyl)propionate/3-hydroxycinnamic acid hydroxylase n=1 Tax=unclassified Actinomadura TaxID=2626254 RepID=UPI003A810525